MNQENVNNAQAPATNNVNKDGVMKKIPIKVVREKLAGIVDTVSVKHELNGDVFTVRRGYFYRMGASAEKLANTVKRIFPTATILDSGDHWAAFRGGASVAQGSHFYVKFTLESA